MADEDITNQFTPDIEPDDMLDSYNSIYGKVGPQLASMKVTPDKTGEAGELGFLNWYEQYAVGARGPEDADNIRAWKSVKAAHGSKLIKNPTPKRAFALRNWAIDPLKLITDLDAKSKLKKEMQEYKDKMETDWREKHGSFDMGELTDIATFLNNEHDAGIPIATVSNPQLEQHILDFVNGTVSPGDGILMEAGVDGLENVQEDMKGYGDYS